ncbi:MAG: DUF3786 domain-containing protein [Deltaproteobacteria bacterium]|jgi:hypothetical protein|nr:DUF3786 domain-containing protein [Deltaproteobacteria bacterium]
MPSQSNAQSYVSARQDFSRHPHWDDLLALDPSVVAEKSGASYEASDGGGAFGMDFMGARYRLNLADRTAVSPPGRSELDYNAKIVLLAYLVKSAAGPSPGLSGREVGPHSLPCGDLFFKGPHELPKAPLAKAFGSDPGALARASAAIGAETLGALAWKARVLPKVEVYYYLDPADDEFPADARYNYDANVCYYLSLDMIFALTNFLAQLLISVKET